MKRPVFGTMLMLLLMAMLSLSFNFKSTKAEWTGTVYIRADGSIDPPDAPISTIDNVTYTLTGNITSYGDGIIVERDNIVIDGAGYTIQGRIYGGYTGVNLSSRNNVTIQNVSITNFGRGILLDNSSNNTIVRNNIANNFYIGVTLYDSLNNIIVRNNVTDNDLYGIWLLGFSKNNNIAENKISNNGIGIWLSHVSRNSIIGNSFFNNGMYVMDSYENVIVDNFVNDKPLVYLEGISYSAIENAGQVILINCNYILVKNLNLSHTNIGIELWGTNNTDIIGNNITANNQYGILLHSSSNNTIIGNNITNNQYGIYLDESSSNNIISGNNITNGYVGIDLFSVNNSIIKNNIGNNLDGIHTHSSSNNTIIGNNIKANKEKGILIDYSSNNIIARNNIANNKHGIDFYHSSYSSIVENNITANEKSGIRLSSSSNNIIYHNNFIDNRVQADSHGSVNVWDDGFPSGGNYWSDYAGIDLYSGPYQNETGSDGIGDTPYVIDENNIDHYPLMNPWTPKPSVVNATVDIQPQALNLRSIGKWITVYIEFPKGYDVSNINVSTIMLNDTIPIEPKPMVIGDYDNDSIPDLMVKFDRQQVINYIMANVDMSRLYEERFMTITLTVTGKLNNSTPFQGSDTIKIILPMPKCWRLLAKLGVYPF